MLIGAVINSIIVSEVIAVLTRVDRVNGELRLKQSSIAAFFATASMAHPCLESKLRKVAEYSTRYCYV